MAKIPYNPHTVSRTERLAFRFKADPVVVIDLKARRRYRNPALMAHELPMRYVKIGQRVGIAPQYVKDVRVLTPYVY